jgi:ParB-like chromosome segregation protein Spo0J
MSERRREDIVVPIKNIHRSIVELRAPQIDSPKYIETRDSIAKHGVQLPPIVRPVYEKDAAFIEKNKGIVLADCEEEQFVIVDGLQRVTCCEELGFTEIKVIATDYSIEESLVIQYITNDKGVPTKPGEFSKHMCRLLAADPTRTAQSLSEDLCIDLNQIKTALKLKGLSDDILKMVDEGMIKLTNAYTLAKLPSSEHESFFARAQTDDPSTFAAAVKMRRAAIAKEHQTGQSAVTVFEPSCKRRAVSDIKVAIETAGKLCDGDVQSFKEGLKYAISLDDVTVNAARAKWELEQADKLAAKEARDAERVAKKEAADAKKEAELLSQNPMGNLEDI